MRGWTGDNHNLLGPLVSGRNKHLGFVVVVVVGTQGSLLAIHSEISPGLVDPRSAVCKVNTIGFFAVPPLRFHVVTWYFKDHDHVRTWNLWNVLVKDSFFGGLER